jgi:MFS family permease
MLLTKLWIVDTLPWAQAEASGNIIGTPETLRPRYPTGIPSAPTTIDIFKMMSWRDKRLMALSQAGLVEKFVDALVWIFYPVFLYQQGISLLTVGWIISFYGFTWGGSQLFTGRLSDRIGRHILNVYGMWICGAGVAAMMLGEGIVWWAASSVISGFGMALLYPNLSAAVADISHPSWRGSAIGIYRFWRDLGYGIGALALGLAAHVSGQIQAAFWFVALAMFASGSILWWLGEETHPRLNPMPPTDNQA